MIKEFFADIIDFVLPPRPTERVVRSLDIEILQSLGGEEPMPYHDPRVTALVWELKYHGTRRSAALAGEYMAEILLAAASEELGVPLLIPVPMHAARLRERGHNQTELLCKESMTHIGNALEYAPKALIRTMPAETSLAIFASCLVSNVTKSTTDSIEVFTISAIKTMLKVNIKVIHSK